MYRRTKIVTTLGPATDNEAVLEQLISAGANMVRLNFSHGTAEEHINRAEMVRRVSLKLGVHVAILGDLQGPKIRISTFQNDKIELEAGDDFILDSELPAGQGDQHSVGLDYKNLPKDLVIGDVLLLDDGRVRLTVTDIKRQQIHTKVTVPGTLSNNKGINKYGGGLSAAALTEKDKRDILTAAKINVDYLAISFPRSSADMQYARRLAESAGLSAKLVAKVERAEVVATDSAIDDIISASDAVMVARGDLGVEIGDAELMGVQKRLIRHARRRNRVVITATQMMESMINNPMPTRAEVMDVANAVLDGTDAVMLSGETAVGKYPVETLRATVEICIGAEKHPSINVSRHRIGEEISDITEILAMATMYAANHLKGVKAIISLTESGSTPLLLSRVSSGLRIFALSSHASTLTRTALYRGVCPILFDSSSHSDISKVAKQALEELKALGELSTGDLVLFTHGDTLNKSGATNSCKILKVT